MTPELGLLRAFLPAGTTVVALGPGAAAWSAGLAADRRAVAAEAVPADLDAWLAERGLRHVDGLLLHGEGAAAPALAGAAALLRLRRVDFVQFDHTAAGGDEAALYARLQAHGYALFRFAGRNLEFRREPAAGGDPCTHLATAPRHWKRLFARDPTMFRYADLFPRHGVVPRGIIHAGAHEGEEYAAYAEAGCRRVVFIEADPAIFARLAARFAGNPDVLCVNRAVSDTAGRAVFRRMSGSQSGSLLAPARHLDLYPHITPAGTVEVETAPLPDILADHGLDPADWNVLALDVQGAERLVLAGCGALLDRFDAVVTEVNYAELYEGCGRIADLDDILFPRGFARVEEVSPHHHGWGDAFYVRR
ncbi:FkbM family methyltransferase [Azospirillum halopraeferens]|uniref:FkbM family methyltransferase n=1 Tax=Azospirillum halopraeferens TaxID=34010 RepID=UPI000422D2F2|nr:FkbM family methyltransferase [Azospirillum halopraeferens]